MTKNKKQKIGQNTIKIVFFDLFTKDLTPSDVVFGHVGYPADVVLSTLGLYTYNLFV